MRWFWRGLPLRSALLPLPRSISLMKSLRRSCRRLKRGARSVIHVFGLFFFLSHLGPGVVYSSSTVSCDTCGFELYLNFEKCDKRCWALNGWLGRGWESPVKMVSVSVWSEPLEIWNFSIFSCHLPSETNFVQASVIKSSWWKSWWFATLLYLLLCAFSSYAVGHRPVFSMFILWY